MQVIRKHLTYANVMATVAVFLALGGSAWALAKHSVGTKQLKNNAVSSQKLKKGAVTKGKLADGAVNGAKIADGSVAISDVSASLHLLCRSGTSYVQGACIQNIPVGEDTWLNAVASCHNVGGRLPSPAELFTLRERGALSNDPSANWSDTAISGIAEVVSNGGVGGIATNSSQTYRCVSDPTG